MTDPIARLRDLIAAATTLIVIRALLETTEGPHDQNPHH